MSIDNDKQFEIKPWSHAGEIAANSASIYTWVDMVMEHSHV